MDENELIRGVDPAEQAEMLKLPKGYHWWVGWGCASLVMMAACKAVRPHTFGRCPLWLTAPEAEMMCEELDCSGRKTRT